VTDRLIIERDLRCVRCGGTLNLHVHHRLPRSAGADERPCNKITLCANCHRWVHEHPRLSRIQGWIVPRHADPAVAPARHYGQDEFVLLDNDYGFAPWPPLEETTQ
jgi:5-methylcytosine-specific restriction endonuclease McrA